MTDDVVISPPANEGVMSGIGGFLGGPVGAALGTIGSGLFNRRAARKERQHQEAREDSRFQRTAADLEKAGLNRILALGSPGSGVSSGVAAMGDVGSSAVSGQKAGLDTKRQQSMLDTEKEVLTKTIGRIEAETTNLGASTAKQQADEAYANQAVEESKTRQRDIEASAQLKELQSAQAKAIAEMYESLGVAGIAVETLLGNLGGGSAKAIMKLLPSKKGK